jgi:3-methylcrotonyl-CoA carboxylase alpha subunit
MKTIRAGEKVWVQWQGRLYSLPLELRKNSRTSESATQELVAPFSCKVLRVNTQAGQSLKKGDPVVVVEAMKMEYSYASPKDGVVDAVLVKEGEVVSGGAQFIRWRNS